MFSQSSYTLLFEDVTFSPLIFVQVISIFDCARLCIKTQDCSSFFYNHGIKSCGVSTNRYRDSIAFSPQAGTNYYSMRPDCPIDWDVMSDQCYKISSTGAAADQAQLNCEAMGGYLAKTDSDADNAVIKGLMTKYSTGFWIGGTDQDVEGTWIWRDGTPVTVDGWADGQPDTNTDIDDCIEQWAAGNGWNDGQCWFPLLYLCEI